MMKQKSVSGFSDQRLLEEIQQSSRYEVLPVEYLAGEYGKPEKSFNDRFHLRRSHIFDYDVIYGMQRLDAATA